MNFIVCFSSVYGSVNFWQRMDEFYGMFFIHLWGIVRATAGGRADLAGDPKLNIFTE